MRAFIWCLLTVSLFAFVVSKCHSAETCKPHVFIWQEVTLEIGPDCLVKVDGKPASHETLKGVEVYQQGLNHYVVIDEHKVALIDSQGLPFLMTEIE